MSCADRNGASSGAARLRVSCARPSATARSDSRGRTHSATVATGLFLRATRAHRRAEREHREPVQRFRALHGAVTAAWLTTRCLPETLALHDAVPLRLASAPRPVALFQGGRDADDPELPCGFARPAPPLARAERASGGRAGADARDGYTGRRARVPDLPPQLRRAGTRLVQRHELRRCTLQQRCAEGAAGR